MDPVSLALTIAGWLISKLISQALDGDLQKWVICVRLGDEVDNLKQKLHEIAILLDSANRSNVTNRPLLQSITDLQQAAYDTEDLFEELDYYRLQDAVEKKHDHETHVSGPAPHKSLIMYHNVVSDLWNMKRQCTRCVAVKEPKPLIPELVRTDLLKRIKDIMKRLDRNGEVVHKALSLENLGRIAEAFSFKNLHQITKKLSGININPVEISRANQNITVDGASVFGRAKEKEEIVNLLKSDNLGGGNIWVLPIVGIGGIGKTTLAKLVYNDEEVKEYFGNKRMWISVSPDTDVKNLTQDIMKIIELEGGTYKDLNAQHVVHTKLGSEKMLLVVDNLCAVDTDDDRWNCLRKLFRGTKEKGTKIMVTTRYPSFAKIICTKGPIELKGLERNELEELFDACAFPDENWKDYPFLRKLRQRFLERLKGGHPLEVKTIGSVLSKKLDVEHWTDVLKSDEWKNPNGKDESKHIMASLKISYQYLPSNLQKCFTYCSLFPKNFKFRGDDLINLWMAQRLISSKNGYKSKKTGVRSLSELVGRGFFEEVEENIKYQKAPTTYYRMHELVHDLAKIISFEEFLTIDGSYVGRVGTSIRHVSIITHSAYECDNSTNEISNNFENNMVMTVRKLEIEKLRTLILIGNYNSDFAKTFQKLFKKAKSLRVLRLSMVSSTIDSLLCTFSNSLLLRYLKLDRFSNPTSYKKENKSHINEFQNLASSSKKENKSDKNEFQNIASSDKENKSDNNEFRNLFRLYHLETLDISNWYGDFNLPGITSMLINLRRFYAKGEQVAKISEIGKLAYLVELPEFIVQKEEYFDITQLGELTMLGGSLSICDLECINSTQDAIKANLLDKKELHDLSLSWSPNTSSPQHSEAILNCLEPPPNIGNLDIQHYPGTKFPCWMDKDRSLSYLRSLKLANCNNLEILPPFGQLPGLEKLYLEGLPRVTKVTTKFYGRYEEKAFAALREMVFSKMSNWDEWVGIDDCKMFPLLKKLEILHCSSLCELPKQFVSGEMNSCFPSLEELRIESCPKLTVPPLPHSQTLNNISISGGPSPLKKLSLSQSLNGLSLSAEWMVENTALDQNMLFFPNLRALVELTIKGCSIDISLWNGFQQLVALRRLIIKDLAENTKNKEKWVLPKSIELLEISSKHVTASHVSACLLDLQNLLILVIKLPDITSIEVENEQTASKGSSSNDETKLRISSVSLRSLKEISIIECEELVSLILPQNGLRGFSSLEKLTIKKCSKLCSLQVANNISDEISIAPVKNGKPAEISIASVNNGKPDDNSILPPRLLQLEICQIRINLDSRLLSNLTRLTHLKLDSIGWESLPMDHFAELQEFSIENCTAMSSLEGVSKLSSLRMLKIFNCPKLLVDWKGAFQKEKKLSKKFPLGLKELVTDETSFLTNGICRYLSTLTKLVFDNLQLTKLAEEQERALFMLTSIRQLNFQNCSKLQYLPNNLYELHELRTLEIIKCPGIKSLLDNQLPDSMELFIDKYNSQLVECCNKLNSTKIKVSLIS